MNPSICIQINNVYISPIAVNVSNPEQACQVCSKARQQSCNRKTSETYVVFVVAENLFACDVVVACCLFVGC